VRIGAGDQPAAGCHEAKDAGGDDDQLTCCGQQLASRGAGGAGGAGGGGRWMEDLCFAMRPRHRSPSVPGFHLIRRGRCRRGEFGQVIDLLPLLTRWRGVGQEEYYPFCRRLYATARPPLPLVTPSLHLQFCKVVRSTEGLMPEIVVHALDGRSVEQKRALIKDLTDAVVRNYGVDAGTVTINIVESAKENKARGGVLFSDMAAQS
jgi:4-oxalocrotonate tautomerase